MAEQTFYARDPDELETIANAVFFANPRATTKEDYLACSITVTIDDIPPLLVAPNAEPLTWAVFVGNATVNRYRIELHYYTETKKWRWCAYDALGNLRDTLRFPEQDNK